MGKTKTETIKNPLNGEEAAITWVQRENHGRPIPIIKKIEVKNMGKKMKIEKTEQPIPITTSESAEIAKAVKTAVKDTKKSNRMETPKVEISETKKSEPSEKPKSELSKLQKEVLKFISNLDHPAITNEVRDHFGFPLRANARVIFKKLAKLGFGENRKIGNHYEFFVKGKKYPKPKAEVETKKK